MIICYIHLPCQCPYDGYQFNRNLTLAKLAMYALIRYTMTSAMCVPVTCSLSYPAIMYTYFEISGQSLSNILIGSNQDSCKSSWTYIVCNACSAYAGVPVLRHRF